MKVEVLLFSTLKDAVGASRIETNIGPGWTGADLLEHLQIAHGSLGAYRDVIRLAKNSEYVGSDCLLEDGDEIALITPVSGG